MFFLKSEKKHKIRILEHCRPTHHDAQNTNQSYIISIHQEQQRKKICC